MSDWDENFRNFVKGVFGDTNERRVQRLQSYVTKTNALEAEISKLSDDALRAKTAEFRERIEKALKNVPDIKLMPDDAPKMPGQIRTQKDKVLGEVLEQLLPEAFAVVRETGKRVLNMRHFDVQILGGAALHFNKIAEMRTGEGKTLVATLPVYLNALAGRGAHVVTVNDYLARRDAEWMGQIYKFLGMTVGLVYSHQPDWEKVDAYKCDITYGTNHEYGFDYLRDNMRTDINDLVQRPYFFGIVDEVDNILIDEARTPLIISGAPAESFTEVYKRMAQIAPLLERAADKESEDADYWVDEKQKSVLITERGVINAEKLLGVKDLFDMHFNLHHHLVQALKAKELFKLDSEYVIRPNEDGVPEITIVDEFTGRMMVGRRWSEGLHQAVEAKENVPIQEETMTFASITYQNLFRLYPKLAGMTGTAMTEAPEFAKIYNLEVIAIPTNKQAVRLDHADIIYKTEMQKYYSVVEEIIDMHLIGRPVLVGTVSIERSELLSELLSKPQRMNEYLLRKVGKMADYVKKHNIDSQPIKDLKKIMERPGQIEPDKLDEVVRQIDREHGKKHPELIERLFSINITARAIGTIRKGIPHNVLNAKHHEREAHIVAQAGRKGAVTVATNMAGRGTDILLGGNPEFLAKEEMKKEHDKSKSEEELDFEDSDTYARMKELTKKHKETTDIEHDEVVRIGGLHILGTERHESRRIDNQLRGRAGRQGDPGSARFFLSLEDQLMRIFGGEKIASLMDMMGADEEMPIEHKLVTRSIQNAQKKVEAHNFDIRKHVLQYDDVLNTQREVIYRERRRVLENNDLKKNIKDMIAEHVELVLEAYIEPDAPADVWLEEGLPEVINVLESDIPQINQRAVKLAPENLAGNSYDDLRHKFIEVAHEAYEIREQELGAEVLRNMERQILLRTIDTKWVDYLHNIDLLRDGVNLRSYGQKDPLQEYKREAFDMFTMLLRHIQHESVQLIFRAQPVIVPPGMSIEDMEEMEGLDLQSLTEHLPPELRDALAIHGITLDDEPTENEDSEEQEDDESEDSDDSDAEDDDKKKVESSKNPAPFLSKDEATRL